MTRTVRIGDPDNPGAWLQITVVWLCPVPSCKRPWSEPRFVALDYHDGEGVRTARVRVHRWDRTCRHVVLNRELIALSRTMAG